MVTPIDDLEMTSESAGTITSLSLELNPFHRPIRQVSPFKANIECIIAWTVKLSSRAARWIERVGILSIMIHILERLDET